MTVFSAYVIVLPTKYLTIAWHEAFSAWLGNRIRKNQSMISKEAKDKVIKKFKTHDGDTGSPQVQIALLSYEIEELSKHLQEHKKDHSSRRGLLKKVGQRRRLLRYLKKDAPEGYQKLIKELKLKDTIA